MRWLWFVLCLMIVTPSLIAQDVVPTLAHIPPDTTRYTLEPIVTDLERPVYVTHAGDGSGRLFIVEQAGHIHIYDESQQQETLFLDLTGIANRGSNEQGLLGLAFHPAYAENGQFFVHYSGMDGGETVLARYTVSADNQNVADADSATILLTHPQPFGNHNGGMITFGPDGYLYIGLGDGGSGGDPFDNAQNPQSLLGKILRLDVDTSDSAYAIPEDNPANTINEVLAPEVWAWGLRNPWRFSFDRATGDLYIADVGQNQWEEINFEPADSPGGLNYGWRILEGTHAYSGAADPGDLTPPIAEYNHSEGCSVTGGYVYRGEMLPELQGLYFYGDVCSGTIWMLYRDSDNAWQTQVFMANTGYSISSFGEDENGELYIVDMDGSIFRLTAA